MSISRTTALKNKSFEFGSVSKAYNAILSGQTGKGWSRSITAYASYKDGTQHQKQLTAADLESIQNVTNEPKRIVFNFMRDQDRTLHEFVQIECRDSEKLLHLHVSASTVDRRNAIEDAIVSALSLEALSEEEARDMWMEGITKPESQSGENEQNSADTTNRNKILESPAEIKSLELLPPDKMTFKWWWTHAPTGWTLTILGLISSAFLAGMTFEGYMDTIKNKTSDEPARADQLSSSTPRLPTPEPTDTPTPSEPTKSQ